MEADAPTEQHFFAMRHDGKPLMEFALWDHASHRGTVYRALPEIVTKPLTMRLVRRGPPQAFVNPRNFVCVHLRWPPLRH